MAQSVASASAFEDVSLSWREKRIDVADITSRLDELRRHSDHTATRTAVMNLVVRADSLRERSVAKAAIDAVFCAGHPGRTILISCRPAKHRRLDAEVTLWQRNREGHLVWWEEIAIHASGPVCERLDSVVRPLALPELPVALWFASGMAPLHDRLNALATALVVDTAAAATGKIGVVNQLATAVELSRRYAIVDLAWIRLGPWRQSLARLFDSPSRRAFIGGVESAEVGGPPGARHLWAGWLVDRLGVAPPSVRQEEADSPWAVIRARDGARRATFEVKVRGGTIDSRIEVDGIELTESSLALPDDILRWSLSQGVVGVGRDRLYERAAYASLGLVS